MELNLINLEWNPTFSKGQILQKVGSDISVQHWVYDLGALVTKRDFLVVRRIKRTPEGGLIIAEKSVKHGYTIPNKFVVNFKTL
jgi:hypothetical protein